MNKNEDFTAIFENIFTVSDARYLIEDLTALSEEVFQSNKETNTQKIASVLPFAVSEKISRYCHDHQISLDDPSKLASFFENLTRTITALPVMTLYVAFLPTEYFVAQLSGVVSRYCGQKVLLEIVTEKHLVGGAIIAWKGIYKDYSVRKRIDEQYRETKGLGL